MGSHNFCKSTGEIWRPIENIAKSTKINENIRISMGNFEKSLKMLTCLLQLLEILWNFANMFLTSTSIFINKIDFWIKKSVKQTKKNMEKPGKSNWFDGALIQIKNHYRISLFWSLLIVRLDLWCFWGFYNANPRGKPPRYMWSTLENIFKRYL